MYFWGKIAKSKTTFLSIVLRNFNFFLISIICICNAFKPRHDHMEKIKHCNFFQVPILFWYHTNSWITGFVFFRRFWWFNVCMKLEQIKGQLKIVTRYIFQLSNLFPSCHLYTIKGYHKKKTFHLKLLLAKISIWGKQLSKLIKKM